MKTVVYLMRHSKTLKVDYVSSDDSILLQNEKSILSVEGEKLAYEHSKKNEFDDIDVVISSNYTRAIGTAKYIADRCNLEVQVMSEFNERIHGVLSWNMLPDNFEILQFNDDNYKIGNGESQKEVRDRMSKALKSVINKYRGCKIAIVSHNTAIMYLLKKWCDIEFLKYIKYKDKMLFNGESSYLLTFKLVFDDDELVDIDVLS